MHVSLAGLPLCGVDEEGVRWSTQRDRMTGWGSPSSTVTAVRKARAHGAWAGQAWLDARHLTLGGNVYGADEEQLSHAIDRLSSAAALGAAELVVTEGTRTRRVWVRREDDVSYRPIALGNGQPGSAVGAWSIQLFAPDPRKFADAMSAQTTLPSTTGGLAVPFAVPFSIDATTVTGQVSLTNPGNIAGPVRLRIDGPARGPIVTHVSSGRSLVFASSVVLGAGEWIDVDMERREVLANGQASRNGWVTQRGWSGFEPGENTWTFSAAAFDPASRLIVEATPAWM